MKKRAPKNKKITFDDDEPAEKKVKGTCSKKFFRTNEFEGIFRRYGESYQFRTCWDGFSVSVPTWY